MAKAFSLETTIIIDTIKTVRKVRVVLYSRASFLPSMMLRRLVSFERARAEKARRRAMSTCGKPDILKRCLSALFLSVAVEDAIFSESAISEVASSPHFCPENMKFFELLSL